MGTAGVEAFTAGDVPLAAARGGGLACAHLPRAAQGTAETGRPPRGRDHAAGAEGAGEIRPKHKAHENDNESAPDTTPAYELIREVQKAMQSPGDRVQQFTEMFCKAFQLKYKRLSQEERSLLKKLFKRSPLIKQSGMNFRRRPWK